MLLNSHAGQYRFVAVSALVFFVFALFSNENRANSADKSRSGNDAEIQDLLFCAPRRPFLIRLHVSVNGKGFRVIRQQWADAKFVALDVDQSGFLEGDELKHLPSRNALGSGLTDGSAGFAEADSDPVDGKVSATECGRYLLATTTPFALLTQANRPGMVYSDVNDATRVNLFPKLDCNRDGILSREEIAAASAKLRSYDRNEDDAVDAFELQQGLPVEQAGMQQKLLGVLAQLIVVDASNQGQMSRRLLESYDKVSRDPATRTFRKDERLSRTELSIEADDFDHADRNHNGQLDRTELVFLSSAMTPSVELAIDAPSVTGTFSIRSLRPCDKADVASIDLKLGSDDEWLLVLNSTAFSLSACGPHPHSEELVKATYVQQFKNLDQDRNDYLDRAELQRFGFPDTFFTQADSDADEKLFEKEYQAHVELQIELSKTRFVLEVGGNGRSLFRLIDTNPADGRLTLRELAKAPEKLTQWDENGDGAITQNELSTALNAVFRAGTPYINGPLRIPQGRPVTPKSDERRNDAQGSLPSWFLKMDRNGDDDLSPREFLGGPTLFDKIDQNRDGLISADEAISADAFSKSQP